MTKRKQAAREALKNAADKLVAEVWNGEWDHIAGIKTRPLFDLNELFAELEKRAPGHSYSEYQDAFCRAYINNR